MRLLQSLPAHDDSIRFLYPVFYERNAKIVTQDVRFTAVSNSAATYPETLAAPFISAYCETLKFI
jgi:hypothetical protein